MCHILIPVKMTIAICFLDILYVAYGENNFIFLGIWLCTWRVHYEHVIFSDNQSAS